MRLARLAAAFGGVWLGASCALAQDTYKDPNPDLNKAPDELPTHVVKVLRTSNKAQTNRYVPKVYDLKHVNPYAVIRWVRRFMQIEESGWFSFANPDLNGGKLMVICPEYQIPGLDQLIATIDREQLTSADGTKRICYRLRHRDANDTDVQALAAMEGTHNALLIADPQLNAWFVQDTPSGFERIVNAVVSLLDQPTPQLEALLTVYELDLTDDGRLGLDYVSWKNGPGRNLFAAGAFWQREKIDSLEGPAGPLFNSGNGTAGLPGREWESGGRNIAYFYDVPSAYFQYLVSKGLARVLTSSKLVALNRNLASLSVGENILFYKTNDGGDLRAGSRLKPLDPYGDLPPTLDTSKTGELTDTLGAFRVDHPDNRTVVPKLQSRTLGAAGVGFFFSILPTINVKNATVQVSMSVVNHTGYADDGTPVLASRAVDTVMKVPHDTHVITFGGLVRQRRVDSANKMPWLGDLPIVGYLFGGESRLDQKSLVVCTLQTQVLADLKNGGRNGNPADDELYRRARNEVDTRAMDKSPGFLSK